MSSAVETLIHKIKQLWVEVYSSGKDEFATENILIIAQIKEHEEALRKLEK